MLDGSRRAGFAREGRDSELMNRRHGWFHGRRFVCGGLPGGLAPPRPLIKIYISADNDPPQIRTPEGGKPRF